MNPLPANPRRVQVAALAALAVVFGIHALAFAITRTDLMDRGPFVLSLGVFLDLVITAPLAVYLIGIRAGGLPRWLLLLTVIAGLATATAVLPDDQRAILGVAGLAWAAGELAILAFLLTRAGTVWRLYRDSREDGLSVRSALEHAIHAVSGRPLVAALLAQELAVLYYGIAGWLVRPPTGAMRFAYHRKNPWLAVMLTLAFLTVAEGVGVHVLVRQFSPVAAMVISALHVYTLLWLLGDYQLMRHTPIRLTADELLIEIGFRRRVRIARADILAIAPDLPHADEHVDALAMGDPNLVVQLARPVSVERPFGRREMVRSIGLKLDDPEAFLAVYDPQSADS